ncbi:hypothetical protein RhiirA5_437982 [Rhizophagus irregularis]|uniref:Uncharacterized protein n=2 Tax=Rhizophagus irregularis TaxID=588596 RepID=A0A2N0NJS0_9GLOM|nr:hypothetical protein RhiirA5_437982 [Rhizophagus irregularis]
MSKTPSAILNSKICGKKAFLPDNVENSVSTVLSHILTVINKKIDSCVFEQNKVRIIFKKNEGRTYIDLQELSSSFTFINKDNLTELENYKNLYELGPWISNIKVIMDFWPKTPLFAETQKIVFCKYLSIQ